MTNTDSFNENIETSVMCAGLMVAFIYHVNAHETVIGALQTWEVFLTCLLHVVHHCVFWHNSYE